jgi:hypothetical protein
MTTWNPFFNKLLDTPYGNGKLERCMNPLEVVGQDERVR